MTIREFIQLLSEDEKSLDKRVLFDVYIDGDQVIMEVDGIDEASDDSFVGVNLKEV